MNGTLEAMARAIFKSWFVDFDPVRAKAEGRHPEGMDAATAALFPDSFQDSKLGPIPTGWKIGTLGDIAANRRDRINLDDVPPDTPYIGLEHIPIKSVALADWGTANAVTSNKSLFSEGDFLFGKLRPYFHKVGIAATAGICSTDILVITPKDDHWYSITLMTISSEEFVAYTDRSSADTKMPRTSWDDMSRYEFPISPADVAER